MTKEESRSLVSAPEYDFLHTDPHLGSRIMFLTLGGSHAYGTNVEGSDVDVRGVTLNSPQELLGLGHFEQFLNNETDTTVYAFNKYISLICNCNPNTIEMLGGEPEHYLMVSPEGQMLLDNKSLFLSQRAVHSFGGYAQAQLRRLQVPLAKERVSPVQKGEYILATCNSAMRTLEDAHHIPHGLVRVKQSDALSEDGEPVIAIFPDSGFADFEKNGLELYNVAAYLGELRGIVKSYSSMGHHNKMALKRGDKKLNKHAMHLIRLYLMAFDILEKGEINTYRKNDLPLLMGIRNGVYMQEDGTYRPEFFEMVSEMDARLKRDAKETSLPERPDMKKIEELVMEINRKALVMR